MVKPTKRNFPRQTLSLGQRDNIPLGQAIRLIQKDEVISAIYKLVTAEGYRG